MMFNKFSFMVDFGVFIKFILTSKTKIVTTIGAFIIKIGRNNGSKKLNLISIFEINLRTILKG